MRERLKESKNTKIPTETLKQPASQNRKSFLRDRRTFSLLRGSSKITENAFFTFFTQMQSVPEFGNHNGCDAETALPLYSPLFDPASVCCCSTRKVKFSDVPCSLIREYEFLFLRKETNGAAAPEPVSSFLLPFLPICVHTLFYTLNGR